MNRESQEVKRLFDELCEQPKQSFPQHCQPLDAPSKPGVYIIRKEETVLHVGRTLRGRGGLRQRLKNHLHGSSSFTNEYLKGNGATLRENGYTYQYLVKIQDNEHFLKPMQSGHSALSTLDWETILELSNNSFKQPWLRQERNWCQEDLVSGLAF